MTAKPIPARETLCITPAGLSHAEVLAALHATAFDQPWSAGALAELIVQVTVSGWIAEREKPSGFILMRCAGGEAEILTLAVAPETRRQGVASALVTHALSQAAAAGAATCYLEVADDNTGAMALYRAAGFSETGRRAAYYDRGTERRDALIMSKPLPPEAPMPR